MLLGVLNAFTTATLYAMDRIVNVTHLAVLEGSLSNGVFSVPHDGSAFSLSVVSACSGVSSVVGFLLVGTAFLFTVRGPLVRKVLWLVGGMILLWTINLGRITLIFWAGQKYGEHFAIGVLHPFIGLVTFSLGVAIMILCIRPLGLRLDVGPGWTAPAPTMETVTRAPGGKPGNVTAVPKVYLAISVVLVFGILLGFSDVGLQSYNLVANVAGETKLVSYIDGPVTPVGWTSRFEATYDWAEPLFGDGSIWDRYLLSPGIGGRSACADLPGRRRHRHSQSRILFCLRGRAVLRIPRLFAGQRGAGRPWGGHHRPDPRIYVAAVRELVDRVLDSSRGAGHQLLSMSVSSCTSRTSTDSSPQLRKVSSPGSRPLRALRVATTPSKWFCSRTVTFWWRTPGS